MNYYCGPEDGEWQPEEYYGENDDDTLDDDADEYEDDSESADDEDIEWDGRY